jgi:hypothetical protein
VKPNDKVEGEGSYKGSKDYNERTKKFVDSGKVEQAARDAKPASTEEAHAMEKAERIGKKHAKGEDPALNQPSKVPHEGHGHSVDKDAGR